MISPNIPLLTIAYLANLFPSAVEPYVLDEIQELRKRKITVVACSARRPKKSLPAGLSMAAQSTIYLQPLSLGVIFRAVRLLWSRRESIRQIFFNALADGRESLLTRTKMIVHTLLGACLAERLSKSGVRHIHVHHGYFASWIALIAARILGITYSLTFHGSDLLLHRVFVPIKLRHSVAAFTVSEYNCDFVRQNWPESAGKLVLRRLGTVPASRIPTRSRHSHDTLVIGSAGRLHKVKNHAFLIDACATLKARGVPLLCLIAGDGPELGRLNRQIRRLGLQRDVELLGHLNQAGLERLFKVADVFVLTSRSEGIPVVLMEAMGRGLPVLAPRITGIPELVIDGRTGFLYESGSMQNFLAHVEIVRQTFNALGPLREAARRHIEDHFNHQTNLNSFISELLNVIYSKEEKTHENPVLQQI